MTLDGENVEHRETSCHTSEGFIYLLLLFFRRVGVGGETYSVCACALGGWELSFCTRTKHIDSLGIVLSTGAGEYKITHPLLHLI